MAEEVLILGGGLAGLSAGVALLEGSRGALRPRILERGHLLGGKASSMPHVRGGRRYDVDHGLHVYFDYPNMDGLLGRLGALGGLKPNRHRMFVARKGRLVPFRSWPLPSPFHLVGGLDPRLMAPWDALRAMRVLLAAILLRPERLSEAETARLDGMSFEDFARGLGVPDHVIDSELFRFFGRSGFHHPHPASALAILRATRLVAQNHRALVTRYLDGPLGEVVVDPLVRAVVEAHGGAVRITDADGGGARVEVTIPKQIREDA